jgi:hypothetical protein
MPLKFENSSEAFLSVLTVVVGADQVGSIAERDFLFEKVKSLPSFGSLSLPEFSKLLGQVTDKVYSGVPQVDGALTSAGIDELLAAAKSVLSPELQQAALKAAVQLCESDETDAAEAALLSQIRRAFG